MATVETRSPAAKRASGSSFYAAMRILPPAQRAAMFEIYAFCRAVDDIADSDAPREERLAQLSDWRKNIDAIYTDGSIASLAGLTTAIRRFGLKCEDFHSVIDGMEMDAVADIRAPDFADLDLYCDRVASAVGRLSVRVFGMPEAAGLGLAHHLGRALQLTNILRDLDEDAAVGRLYLPREALHEAGIHTTEPAAVLASPSLGRACAIVIARAREHFAQAEKIMSQCSRRPVRAPRIMCQVYRFLLDGMVARGWNPPRDRVKVPRTRLIWILLRYAVV